MKQVVEPTGCLAAAAVLERVLDLRGQRVGVIVSGGNVDRVRYGRWLGRRRSRANAGEPMCGMSDATATQHPTPTDADKRQRETVDKLLARAPVVSTGAVTLSDGRRLDYEVSAAFMPLTTGGVDAQRGEPQAAVFTVAYTVRDARRRGRCALPSTADRVRRRSGCTWARSARSAWWCTTTARMPHGAVCGAGQPAHLARALRPGVRRSAAHRLLGRGQRRGAQEAVLGGRRRRRAVRGGARVAGAAQALRLGAVPGRRELRHHARRGASPTSCRRWACRCRA